MNCSKCKNSINFNNTLSYHFCNKHYRGMQNSKTGYATIRKWQWKFWVQKGIRYSHAAFIEVDRVKLSNHGNRLGYSTKCYFYGKWGYTFMIPSPKHFQTWGQLAIMPALKLFEQMWHESRACPVKLSIMRYLVSIWQASILLSTSI